MILGFDGRLANLPQRAGVGNLARCLIEALPAAMGDWRLRVYLDAGPRPDFPVPAGNREIRVLPKKRFWTQRILPRELKADPPSVFLSPVMQFPLRCPCPGIATIPDLAAVTFGSYFTLQRRLLARFQARQAVRQADHLFALSGATRDDIRRYYGAPEEKITVIWAGVSSGFHPVRDAEKQRALREKYGLPEKYVLYLGRIQPRKNLDRLIDAFSETAARHPELPHHLVLAGDRGWMDQPIREKARRSPAADRIHFTGFIDEEDLAALISAADALALVSLWEGFGLPIIEAMACGTAVITSDCSSLPEVAGDAALIVNPEDTGAISAALDRLLRDQPRRHELEEKGFERARLFTWEKTAQRVMDAVKRLAVQPG
jgi:glycosyltransferase involved in cell wall biosynthesis